MSDPEVLATGRHGGRPPVVNPGGRDGTISSMLLKGRRTRLARQGLAGLGLLIMSAAVAIAVALKVTPQQTVTLAGQVIEGGASAPSLSLSGPGEGDPFGQSPPTNILFTR